MSSSGLALEAVKRIVIKEIDRRAEDIEKISDHIMRNPETGYREVRTAQLVQEQLTQMGVPFRSDLAVTGVKGRLTGRTEGPTIAILGELDAMIAVGHPYEDPDTHAAHACGHNAQVAAMLGAGMGLRPVMEALDGDVVLFATPAEEGIETQWRLELKNSGAIEFLSGKPELIRLGEFHDIDMAMMTHTPAWGRDEHASVGDSHNGSLKKYARFHGRAAHAAGAPWSGVNALKAATLALAAIDAQRDTFVDEDYVRTHFMMPTQGGPTTAIPFIAEIDGMVRGRTMEAINDANEKVDRSLKAGAMAMGATVDIETLAGTFPNRQDPNLVRLAKANCAEVVGEENMSPASHRAGSADLGDVSCLMPVLHPHSGGVTNVSTHSTNYHVVDHTLAAVNPAKWMAMTVVDLLWEGAEEARNTLLAAGPGWSTERYVDERRKLSYKVSFGDEQD